jgi:hypothetical protein
VKSRAVIVCRYEQSKRIASRRFDGAKERERVSSCGCGSVCQIGKLFEPPTVESMTAADSVGEGAEVDQREREREREKVKTTKCTQGRRRRGDNKRTNRTESARQIILFGCLRLER